VKAVCSGKRYCGGAGARARLKGPQPSCCHRGRPGHALGRGAPRGRARPPRRVRRPRVAAGCGGRIGRGAGLVWAAGRAARRGARGAAPTDCRNRLRRAVAIWAGLSGAADRRGRRPTQGPPALARRCRPCDAYNSKACGRRGGRRAPRPGAGGGAAAAAAAAAAARRRRCEAGGRVGRGRRVRCRYACKARSDPFWPMGPAGSCRRRAVGALKREGTGCVCVRARARAGRSGLVRCVRCGRPWRGARPRARPAPRVALQGPPMALPCGARRRRGAGRGAGRLSGPSAAPSAARRRPPRCAA
jgi:hypothetical protein